MDIFEAEMARRFVVAVEKIANALDRKTEPQNYCDDCLYTDTCDSKEFFYACTSKATISKMEQVDKDINVRSKDEPKICDTCRYYNSNIPCGSTPSACKEADKFAEEFVDGLKKLKPKDEPQRDCFLCKWLGDVDVCGRCRNRNLFAEADTEPKPKDEPQTERSE